MAMLDGRKDGLWEKGREKKRERERVSVSRTRHHFAQSVLPFLAQLTIYARGGGYCNSTIKQSPIPLPRRHGICHCLKNNYLSSTYSLPFQIGEDDDIVTVVGRIHRAQTLQQQQPRWILPLNK
jgi:hypothetical protein